MPVTEQEGVEIRMTDVSPGAPVKFKWDFGDGTPLVDTPEKVVKHAYAKKGTYTIVHTAIDGCGVQKICQDTATITGAAGGVPVIALGLVALGMIGIAVYEGGKK